VIRIMRARVLVCCDVGAEDSIISLLKRIETVKNVQGILGLYDIMIELESDDEQKLQQSITQSIRKIPKIYSTMTLTHGVLGENMSIINNNNLNHGKKEIVQKTKLEQAYIIVHFNKMTFTGNEKNILWDLLKIPEIIQCDVLSESYKAICKLAAPTYNDISLIVSKKIREIKYIDSTITLNVISKSSY